ncbi:hypothetical protein Fmac_018602 [Flemingia macrophylla]|uniref:FAE domain-containing protein n=1 Tax=Flemingia macrophylla TaxID=520843 RepID=A0ABD1M5K2_9FABA
MGCCAGLILVDLSKDLLKANPNLYVLLLSTENKMLNWYLGNNHSMLLCNYIFCMGGVAVLLSYKPSDRACSKYQFLLTVRTHKGVDGGSYNCIYQMEEATGKVRVCLVRELMAVVGDALRLFLQNEKARLFL